MKTEIITKDSRGHLNFGWLDTYHTFSFGEYQNPKRMNFGALRVVNDDLIAPNSMFPTHSHSNMEIITVILNGAVEHQDNLGNKTLISTGEIQVMSAGNGISHSEANPSASEELSLFQIWIYPKQQNIPPHYVQQNFSDKLKIKNQWHQLVVPNENKGQLDNQLTINQDAYLSLAEFTQTDPTNGNNYHYQLNSAANGLFIMVINGALIIENQKLDTRDAIMIQDTALVNFNVDTTTRLIAIEVPMIFKH